MTPRTETLHETPWLALKNIHLRSANGSDKVWTYATRPKCAGGVCVIATTSSEPRSILLVRQHRAPVDAPVIEFPAGLIDEGESAADTALRELAEETGWRGEIVKVGPPTLTSAGLTDERIHFVEVMLTTAGEPQPDGDEVIEVLFWPLEGLYQRLAAAAVEGHAVDSKLWTYALGLR